LGLLSWYFGLWKFWPSQWAAKSRLEQWAVSDYEGRIDKTEASPTLTQAIAAKKSADVILAHDRYQIENGVHSCPENSRWIDAAKTHKVMDVASCDSGRSMFWIQIPESVEPKSYNVKIYKYGTGQPQTDLEKEARHQLIRAAEDVTIKICNDNDKFAVAERTSPSDVLWKVEYQLRGRTCFFPNGKADFLELELIQ
jgi:hypothetical protein